MIEKPVRLQLYMARCGLASRRSCERYIAQGRVSVNGKLVCEPGYKVTHDNRVTFDGQVLTLVKKHLYVALHKPPGYLSSCSDPQGRPLAIDLLKPCFSRDRLFHVGRLDYQSSGLLLFTNDGKFARDVSHPSRQIEKEYEVTATRKIPRSFLEAFKRGIIVEGERLQLASFRIESACVVRIVLKEGKNRELRRAFAAYRIPIKTIHRLRIGSIHLKRMAPGEFRLLDSSERRSIV